MDKNEVLAFLRQSNIPYQIAEHPAAKTIEEIDSFHLPNSEYIVKNLFLRDDKNGTTICLYSARTKLPT